MMRKSKILLLIMIVAMLLQGNTFAISENKLIFDNQQLGQNAIIDNGEVKVPLRIIIQKLGYTLNWNSRTKEVYINNTNDLTTTYKIGTGSDIVKLSSFVGMTEITQEKTLSGKVINYKGLTYVPLDLLETFKINYYVENNNVYIFTKLLVVDVTQEDEFVAEVMNTEDIAKVEKLIYAYGTKNSIYAKKFDYLDSRSVEDMYDYLGEAPETAELQTGEYKLDDFLNKDVNKITRQKVTRLKTLTSLTGLDLKFEPVVYYTIGGTVDLIGGYVDHGELPEIDEALKKYVHNYQEISWRLLTAEQKAKVRTEITQFYNELQSGNGFVIVLVQDGKIVYIE